MYRLLTSTQKARFTFQILLCFSETKICVVYIMWIRPGYVIGLNLIVSRRLLPTWHVMPCIDVVLKSGKFFITSLKGNKKKYS